jgi:hypothetical protein
LLRTMICRGDCKIPRRARRLYARIIA